MISLKIVPTFYKMYFSFIEKRIKEGVKVVVHKTPIKDDRGETLHGVTMIDSGVEDNYSVHISPASTTNQVATLLHEFSHKMFPDQDENWIQALEKDLVTSLSTEQLKSFEKFL